MTDLEEKKSFSSKYSLIENAEDIFIGEDIDQEKIESIEENLLAEDLTIVELKNLESTLKTEILYLRRNLGFKDNLTDGKIWNDNNMLGEICYIKKEVAPSGKEKAYIYDKVSGVCFKAQRTKIGANVVHSLTYAQMILDGIEPKGLRTVEFDSKAKVASDEETYFYEPDLNNFSYSTQIVYYSSDFKKQHLISIKEYIDLNRPRTLTVGGEVYTFANYTSEGTQVWANIKTTGGGINSYWVWIPRFAYMLDNGTASVILVDEDNKPLDTEKYGDTLPEEYTIHEAFNQETEEDKEPLKGLWFAKYPPSQQIIEVSEEQGGEV